jgi:DNA-binding beta-propeller fold protein YncE
MVLGCGPTIVASQTTLYDASVVVGGTGATANAVMFDGHNIWVAVEEPSGGYVRELDANGRILSSTSVGTAPIEMAYDGARIWVTDYVSSDVRVIAANGTVVKQFQLPTKADPEGILFDGKYIWVANNGAGSSASNTVSKFDAATLTLVANYRVGLNPDGVAFDGTYIWVTNSHSNNVMKLNRETGAILGVYPTGEFPLSIIFDGRNLWIGNGEDTDIGHLATTGSVTKLRASDGLYLGTFPVGSAVRGLAFDGTSVWICNSANDTFTRLLGSDGARIGTYSGGVVPRTLAFDGTRMWISDSGSATVTVVASSPVLDATLASARADLRPQFRPSFGIDPNVLQQQAQSSRPSFEALAPLQTTVDQTFSNYVVQPPGKAAVAGLTSLLLGDD